MLPWLPLLVSAVAVFALWAASVGGLMVAGRRADAAALARFVPDCIVLFKRLLHDAEIRRVARAVLVTATAYLVFPIDLVPDFIPIAGQLDDVLVVVLALSVIVRSSGRGTLARHWPGPTQSLTALERATGAYSRARS
jgi:uncharacterized membrane protein YkvA (DUF1232 family)